MTDGDTVRTIVQPTQAELRQRGMFGMIQAKAEQQRQSQLQAQIKAQQEAYAEQQRIASPEFQEGAYKEAKRLIESGWGVAGLPRDSSAFSRAVKTYFYQIQKGLPKEYVIERGFIKEPIYFEQPAAPITKTIEFSKAPYGQVQQQVYLASHPEAYQNLTFVKPENIQPQYQFLSPEPLPPTKTQLFFKKLVERLEWNKPTPTTEELTKQYKATPLGLVYGAMEQINIGTVKLFKSPFFQKQEFTKGSILEYFQKQPTALKEGEVGQQIGLLFFSPAFTKAAFGTETIVAREPVPQLKIRSVDVIKVGKETEAGAFRMEIVRPTRYETITSPIEQLFKISPQRIQISPRQVYYFFTPKMEPKGLTSPRFFGEPIITKNGVIQSGGAYLFREGAKTGKTIQLRGMQNKIEQLYMELNPVERQQLKSLAELKIGRPIPNQFEAKLVPQIIGEDLQSRGMVEALQTGKMKVISKNVIELKPSSLLKPKKVDTSELVYTAKKVMTNAEGTELYQTLTSVKPFGAGLRAKTQTIKGVSMIIPYTEPETTGGVTIIKKAFTSRGGASMTPIFERQISGQKALQTIKQVSTITPKFIPKAAVTPVELITIEKQTPALALGAVQLTKLSQPQQSIIKTALKEQQKVILKEQEVLKMEQPQVLKGFEELKLVQPQVQPSVEKLIQPQIQLPKQMIQLKTPQVTEQISILKATTPLVPSYKFGIGKKGKSLLKSMKKFKLGAFEVQVKRRGQFETIGRGLPMKRALRLGAARTMTTLSQTFRLIPKGTTALKDIGYEIPRKIFTVPKRKTAAITYVERRGMTLKRGTGEIPQIMAARRKFKW